MDMNSLAFARCISCSQGKLDAHLACASCGHQYSSFEGIPLLIQDSRSHLESIDQMMKEKPQWYLEPQLEESQSPYKHHLRKRRKYVTKKLTQLSGNSGGKFSAVLDLGCGDGNHLNMLRDFSKDLYASDYSLLRLRRSHQYNPGVRHFLSDILNYACQDNFFDLVFCNHVIEHIEDDVAAMRTMWRILKPGGHLILGTPNEGSWWWQMAYKNDPDSLRTTDHVQFYTGDSLSDRLKSAGFSVQDMHYTGWGPPSWRWSTILRQWKIIDDFFELFGRLLIKKQASSLYVIARK